MKTKEEVKQARQGILTQSRKTVSIKKDDLRTKYLRRCSVCGKPLNQYMSSQNKFIVTQGYKMCYLDDRNFLKLCLCDDIKSCYTHLKIEE